jgi:chromosome segregation protein
MQVERLRLTGFKSFVEPTELTIEPGLTGIVGPNGCGKSNLVEALRWVMGEGSAKRLRGGEMDDVIFAGSTSRPSRNLAEVVLTLDNSARDAPFAFNESPVVEVARRIARGEGSSYLVNGRDVRARDVQLLFADAATGPHSAALVSQGRVAALIAAKPTERRLLLDEAAGTTGLHARRHEAELKLQGAEANLARVDDVIATLAQQIEGLRKQARQAQRYRRLGEQIRQTEALLFAARWHAALADVERVAGELREVERAVAAATEGALAEERHRAEADSALPALRMAQAEAAAAVQRLGHAREALEQELVRVVGARAEAERRRDQVEADLGREAAHLAEAEASLLRLVNEERGLELRIEAAEGARAEAAAQLDAAAEALSAAEAGLQQTIEACATGEARRAALERQYRELTERHGQLQARLAESEHQREPLIAALVPPTALAEAAAAISDAESQVEAHRANVIAAAEALLAMQQREGAAVDRAREAQAILARLQAEAEALSRMLAGSAEESTGRAPVLSLLEVPEGFEAATAALFDGELAAPLLPGDRETHDVSSGWVELAPFAECNPLPEGVQAFAPEIGAPVALARRLGQAGLVATEAAGWELQPQLRPGQSLVDRDGRLWRWDGFTRLAPATSATAERLRQRNRLLALTGEIEGVSASAREAAEVVAAVRAAREAAAVAERRAVAELRGSEERLAIARAAEAELTRRSLAAETRLAALADAIAKLSGEIVDIAAQIAETERARTSLPPPELTRTALEAARAEAAAARRREAEARGALDRLAHEDEVRRHRLGAIAAETEAWRKRRDGAATQRAILDDRKSGLAGEITELAARPAAIAAETEALAETAAKAAARARDTGDALAIGETRLREATEKTRAAEQQLAQARESRARLDAQREAAADMLMRLREEIRERLDRGPEDLGAIVGDPEAIAAADSAALAARLERMLRERENIGPVNLIAEQEMSEAETRLEGLQREREDLTAAIARLRQGISTLNQEGRRRLLAAFDQLSGHFGELFERLFGGGKAELAWVGDGDPLDSGLDIMASPPGKRLQHLSLLSGGEQALTAIALIFAVFLTNPAPICVLDEVDAPLDDANVDRFCRIVAETADATGTRFLLVTHHRITMARMDRLYGVTMAERGVSQLVSVDLARANELRQTA